jgi:hypothetical protein
MWLLCSDDVEHDKGVIVPQRALTLYLAGCVHGAVAGGVKGLVVCMDG